MHIIRFIIPLLFACTIAVGAGVVLNAFNSGELSSAVEGRTDLTEYYHGGRTIENAICVPQGAADKRPGTYYIADANVTTNVRLIPFEYSTDTAYVIEMGDTYMRFYKEQ